MTIAFENDATPTAHNAEEIGHVRFFCKVQDSTQRQHLTGRSFFEEKTKNDARI